MARDDLERGSPQGTAVSTSTSAGDTRTGTGALPGAEKQKSSDNFIFSLRDWVVERFNWSWFTYAQPTGGIGIVLAQCPKQFYGLQTIGTIVFIFNIVLHAGPECYFFGSFWLTIATIIISIETFGAPHSGPWLTVAIRVCYWIYAAMTLISATTHFVTIFEFTPVTAVNMHPASLILVYNTMLTGTIAGTIAKGQPPAQRYPIIVSGVAYQGFGWIASLIVMGWFFGNLMQNGWPAPDKAPGLFITVGAVGFTIVALIGNAKALPEDYGYSKTHPMAPEVLRIVATWTGVFLWLFMLWLFGLALLVVVAQYVRVRTGIVATPMRFNNGCWALIFPNVGFCLATVFVGKQLESNAILWVSTVMIIILVAVWLLQLFTMGKAIYVSMFKDRSRTLL